MAEDPKYKPLPYLYQSHGLAARWAYDRVPEHYYVQLMNCLERDEEGMSSRYGYTIQNRDPNGTPNGQNYFFPMPITSIAKMAFAGNYQRYVGLEDGSLWQRNSNTQGPFSEIYTGLSGYPFDSLVAACYATALPFLFIADEDASVKVAAGSSTVELWGIDPPPYTANALPYSPLLSLIDNFSASNSYDASGFDGGEPWEYAGITTIPGASGTLITDFPQFYLGGYSPTGLPESAAASSGETGPQTITTTISTFPSVAVSAGETITLAVNVSGAIQGTSPGIGTGTVTYQYSVDGGFTWTPFYTATYTGTPYPTPVLFGPTTVPVNIAGLTNLNQLQLQIVAYADNVSGTNPSGTIASAGFVNSVTASVGGAGVFGEICNGMLSVLNNTKPTATPIASIQSSFLPHSFHQALLVTTQSPSGLTNQNLSVYGSSNDLLDGFYEPIEVTASNGIYIPYSFTPPPFTFGSAGDSAAGGTLYFFPGNVPSTCVLTQEYSTPYPSQFSAWGFYEQVPLTQASFPVGCWSGLVDASSTATVGVTANFDLSQNNQVTDSDLIVLTLQVGSPQNISNIRLQFDVNNSGYTSSYYYANITPSYYQGNIANTVAAYQTTQNQILADALGLLTGQPESSTTAQLQPSNFSTGESAWVAVLIPRGNFLPVGSAGQSGLDWTNITGWQVVIETAASGNSTVALNGLYLQWGYGPSSFAGVGYDYRYTYYNANTGTESSPAGEMEFNQQYGYLSSLSAPFYLRQAAQVSGYFSSDSQVTHYRVYRRGGIYANNWLLIDQVPNETGSTQFFYKDVVPDASLAQAQPLILDNDPPVTSSLVTPILTTLAAATTGPGNSIYPTYAPQLIKVQNISAVFVSNQTVLIGNAYNLEEVLVISGGTGQFTAIVRLQHNAGEQVQVNSTPRVFCDLCCTVNLPGGATQVLMAGDKNNPHRVYYAKPNQPENFGPEDYVDSSSPDDPVMALINWRGTGLVVTRNTWYVFIGGSQPYLQPTGATHGIVAKQGWELVEGEIAFRCLPDNESEALTRSGWKARRNLTVGEDILAYDLNSRMCKWTPVEAINVYDFDGELMRLVGGKHGNRFDFSCTSNHKWVWRGEQERPYSTHVVAHPENKSNKYDTCACGKPKSANAKSCQACRRTGGLDRLRAAAELHQRGHVIQASPIDAVDSLLTPREAAILGWIVTDGSICKNASGTRSARIHQKEHGRYIPGIKQLLGHDLMSTYRHDVVSLSGESITELDFAMSTAFSERLLGKAGFRSKRDLTKIVCSLDHEAAQWMLNAMLDADGHKRKLFGQAKGPVMDAFRVLAFLCGYSTNAPRYKKADVGDKEHGITHITRRGKLDCGALKKTRRKYKGKVWCPTTKYGTWVAKSNDTISITGNSADGWRFFSGADGKYMTLPVEWIFRTNPDCLPPQASASNASLDIFAYYNNLVIGSYISLDDGVRYRLIYDTNYQRYRQDDIAATAMLWERDTNLLLCGVPVTTASNTIGYALVADQQYNQDYDDGGWNTASNSFVQVPVNLVIQLPYKDVGRPHFPKQFNVLETDANTQNQELQTTLFFNTEPETSIVLPAVNSGTVRDKLQQKINNGDGQQAYAMSILHTMAVTVAPTLFQENVYAAVLADFRTSFDSYWQKARTNELQLFKEGYFDYSATADVTFSLYANGDMENPYFQFTLPAQANRSDVRVLFSGLKCRLWRMVGVSTGDFQLWSPVTVDQKPLLEGSGYERIPYGVYE